MVKCGKCGTTDTNELVRDRNKSSGFASICRPCDAAKGRAYYAANAHVKRAYDLSRRDQRMAEYANSVAHKFSMTQEEWEKMPHRGPRRSKRWAAGSPPGWAAQRKRILARDGYACQIRGPKCTGKGTECDHITPWEPGQVVSDSSLRAACVPCNRSNGDPSTRTPPVKRPKWL